MRAARRGAPRARAPPAWGAGRAAGRCGGRRRPPSGRPAAARRPRAEYRRAANRAANNGKERKDLYTDNWDGSEYKGSPFNILTLLALLFVATPVAGLAFAKLTYGTLWG